MANDSAKKLVWFGVKIYPQNPKTPKPRLQAQACIKKYKYLECKRNFQVNDLPVFDEYGTGGNNPESALYYCKGCGEIIPLSKNEIFPPCTDCGSATWMNVAVAGEAGARD